MFSFKKSAKGFTLIELLVVVAIIALLAGTILVSLSGARKRAIVSRVKSELSSLRAQGALYEAKNGNFGPAASDCSSGIFADTSEEGMGRLIADIVSNSSGQYCFAVGTPNATAWAVSANFGGAEDWCVDSTGNSKAAAASSTGVCF